MNPENLELSLLSLFAVTSFFLMLLNEKIFSNNTINFFLDKDFNKPQAFHVDPISRTGGLASIILFILYYILDKNFINFLTYKYLLLGIGIFCIGFMDDLKINISPAVRLFLMVLLLISFIYYFSISIDRVDLKFLNMWLKSEIFLIFFILICFLFIINGANLIDGFNGLLAMHLIIINFFLLLINLNNNHFEFSLFLISQIIILSTFLLFNFPRARIFMGDGGSYFFGALVSLNIINSNNLNTQVSSFFFCILLFYLFFEVFFSFFRKLSQRKSPLKPDNSHLHMIIYKLINKYNSSLKSNYLTSVYINTIFIFLFSFSYLLRNNGYICKLIFFILPIFYMIIYFFIIKILKRKNNI